MWSITLSSSSSSLWFDLIGSSFSIDWIFYHYLKIAISTDNYCFNFFFLLKHFSLILVAVIIKRNPKIKHQGNFNDNDFNVSIMCTRKRKLPVKETRKFQTKKIQFSHSILWPNWSNKQKTPKENYFTLLEKNTNKTKVKKK